MPSVKFWSLACGIATAVTAVTAISPSVAVADNITELGQSSATDLNSFSLQPPSPITNRLSDLVSQETPSPERSLSNLGGSEKSYQPSPLERPMFRLFGFDTATPLNSGELYLEFGGNSFGNPKDVSTVLFNRSNRSNDAHANITYGLAPNLQLTAGLSGKDDTIFVNLVQNGSQLQILNNVIPVQAKWRFYNQNRLEAGVVVGAEIPNPVAALFFQPNRVISYTDSTAQPAFLSGNSFTAKDNAIYLSIAAPVSYQVNEGFKLHVNPQVSFLPSRIPITRVVGDANVLRNSQIGFDGQELNYYGTIIGVGLGASYQISPNLQLSADFTPILSGRNSADSGGNNTLFVAHPVWNVGLQYAPNSHSALGLFATNRFSSASASPSNLLVQPGNDWSLGINVSYLPDVGREYHQNNRKTYPDDSSLFMQPSGFPSTTLPVNTVAYSLGVGNSVNPMIRYGLFDDFEVALSYNNASRTEIPIETDLVARWGLLPDRGQSGFSGALDLGLARLDGTGTQVAYSLYADSPISYRLPGGNIKLNATPKILIPAQFQNVSNILGVSLGGSWQIAPNTEITGQVTPILAGQNQLVAGQILQSSGRTPVYSVGIRQLFPAGNSTYGVELYYGNSAGSTGFQGLTALPNGDRQFGVRFSVLNGTPDR